MIPEDLRNSLETAAVAALMTSKRFAKWRLAEALTRHTDDELRQLAQAMTALMSHLSDPVDLPTPSV